MIELNCTYEESKTILELGYDFSSVCWIFRKETPSFKMNLIKFDNDFLVYAAPEGESFGDFINRAYSSVTKAIQAGYVPIIPKAALEKCLPGGLLVDIRCLSTDFRKIFSTPYSKESIELFWDGHSMEADTIIHKSCSIFEMFVWLHENYPEELKRKFNEVMA